MSASHLLGCVRTRDFMVIVFSNSNVTRRLENWMLVKKSHFPRKISDYTEQNFIVCDYELEKTVYLFVTLGNTTNLKRKKGREKNT